LSRLGAAWRPCSCHRLQKGDLGLSLTSRYAGREGMKAEAARVRAVKLPNEARLRAGTARKVVIRCFISPSPHPSGKNAANRARLSFRFEKDASDIAVLVDHRSDLYFIVERVPWFKYLERTRQSTVYGREQVVVRLTPPSC
jgi:hypothetical protein